MTTGLKWRICRRRNVFGQTGTSNELNAFTSTRIENIVLLILLCDTLTEFSRTPPPLWWEVRLTWCPLPVLVTIQTSPWSRNFSGKTASSTKEKKTWLTESVNRWRRDDELPYETRICLCSLRRITGKRKSISIVLPGEVVIHRIFGWKGKWARKAFLGDSFGVRETRRHIVLNKVRGVDWNWFGYSQSQPAPVVTSRHWTIPRVKRCRMNPPCHQYSHFRLQSKLTPSSNFMHEPVECWE